VLDERVLGFDDVVAVASPAMAVDVDVELFIVFFYDFLIREHTLLCALKSCVTDAQ
jgi:hypothetical protein